VACRSEDRAFYETCVENFGDMQRLMRQLKGDLVST
jgi:hypothetical protein